MKNNQFIGRDIIQRAAELLIAEVVISFVLALLVYDGMIPVAGSGLVMLAVGLAAYIGFVIWNSYEYLWLVMEKEIYFKVSYAAYGIVIAISLIVRFLISSIFTWTFFPMKLFMIFGVGRAVSLMLTHLIVLVVITFVGIIINPIIPVDNSEEELAEIGFVPGSDPEDISEI